MGVCLRKARAGEHAQERVLLLEHDIRARIVVLDVQIQTYTCTHV